MTSDATKGRSVETVQAELRAVKARMGHLSDPALQAHVDHLLREHHEARRARQREFEDDLMAPPDSAQPER